MALETLERIAGRASDIIREGLTRGYFTKENLDALIGIVNTLRGGGAAGRQLASNIIATLIREIGDFPVSENQFASGVLSELTELPTQGAVPTMRRRGEAGAAHKTFGDLFGFFLPSVENVYDNVPQGGAPTVEFKGAKSSYLADLGRMTGQAGFLERALGILKGIVPEGVQGAQTPLSVQQQIAQRAAEFVQETGVLPQELRKYFLPPETYGLQTVTGQDFARALRDFWAQVMGFLPPELAGALGATSFLTEEV